MLVRIIIIVRETHAARKKEGPNHDKNNFFLSRNEFNTLLEKENNYFIYFWNKNGPKDEGSGFNINDISDVELNTKEYYLLVIDSTELISISPKDGKHSQWEKALYDASHLV